MTFRKGFDFVGQYLIVEISEAPEPATLLLLGMGGLVLRKSTRHIFGYKMKM